jgi:rhamnose utilization protein RhaD (predicted bifunctional aldolase and dehydrogenase)
MLELDALTNEVIDKLKEQIVDTPNFTESSVDTKKANEYATELSTLYDENAHSIFFTNAQALQFVQSEESMQPLLKPFTPDHIVYCKHNPLILKSSTNIREQFDNYKKEHGFAPKIVAIEKLGFVALGKTKKETETAKLLFLDAMKVAIYANSFGGISPLPDDFVHFILNWEAENYRQKAL